MSCIACGYYKTDEAHIKTRATGGTETIDLCRRCHTAQHKMGWKRFCEKYPPVEYELYSKGWKFELLFGIWKLTNFKD